MGCIDEGGGAAEYVNAASRHLARVPAGVSLEAAACGGIAAITALIALDPTPREGPGAAAADAKIGAENPVAAETRAWIRGRRVLVTGASGGVGLFTVQLARALGAVVTGVCGPSSAEVVRRAGKAHIVDYSVDESRGCQGHI